MVSRIDRLRQKLMQVAAEGLLVTKRENVAYLSGFDGTAGWLLITSGGHGGPPLHVLITDFRYKLRAQREVPGCDLEIAANSLIDAAAARINSLRGRPTLAFESEHLTVAARDRLEAKLARARLVPEARLVEDLRIVKDPQEQELIAEAARIADQAFTKILGEIGPGTTEREVALRLEFSVRELGAEETSFPTIVASGPNSAIPHHQTSDRKIEERELVIIDFGARRQRYCSDMTRTILFGEPTEDQTRIYQTVLAAQQAALEAVRPGRSCREVDGIARRVIEEAGFGDYFGHGLGHGVGLEIHEAPRLARTSEETLAEGMVVTVEPGIYVEEIGGVRIEDLVVVTAEGCRNLTGTPRVPLAR